MTEFHSGNRRDHRQNATRVSQEPFHKTLVALSPQRDTKEKSGIRATRANGRRRVLTNDQMVALVAIIDTQGTLRDQALLSIWMNTGARGKDIRELLVNEITSTKGAVLDRFLLYPSKTNTPNKPLKPVPVFLLPDTVAILQRYLAEAGKDRDSFLFTPLKGRYAGQNRHIHYSTLKKWLLTWMERAGLETLGYGTHSIRRTKGRAVRLGSDIFLESKILGHADIRTTMAYAGEDDEELCAASLDNDPIYMARKALKSKRKKRRKD